MITQNANIRERYLANSIATASPAKLLLMLYDRLVVDLSRAEQALAEGDRVGASGQLIHAQEIVLELRSSLQLGSWEGADALAQLYTYLFGELIQANLKGEPERAAACRTLVEPLRDAWREAAVATADTPAPVPG
jgi:flagellar secretion chaperone FliS